MFVEHDVFPIGKIKNTPCQTMKTPLLDSFDFTGKPFTNFGTFEHASLALSSNTTFFDSFVPSPKSYKVNKAAPERQNFHFQPPPPADHFSRHSEPLPSRGEARRRASSTLGV